MDDIRRNAKLFEEAIDYVNARKAGDYENIVTGFSMGGLVARYALRKMELAGKNHNVCKYFSYDSPHKGANVPVGLQAMVRHIENTDLKLFWFLQVYSLQDIDENIAGAIKILNSTAAKQMLIYYVNKNFNYDNSAHEAFLQEYESLGMPQNCQNIAVSNGSNKGTKSFEPYSQLLSISETTGTKGLWYDLIYLIAHVFAPSTAIAIDGTVNAAIFSTNYREVAVLNAFPGLNPEFSANITVNALPNKQIKKVYSGKIEFKKIIFPYLLILGLPIPQEATATVSEASLYSTADMLPMDGAPGGTYDVFGIPDAYASYMKKDKFCFVPTVSSLCFNNWKEKLTSSLSSGSSTYYYDIGYTPFEKYFAQSINHAHVFNNSANNFLSANLTNGCPVIPHEPDLYVKDNNWDNGMENNYYYFTKNKQPAIDYFSSPDIWVEDLQGNKVGAVLPENEYNVCVKIRNRGNEISNGTGRIFIHWNYSDMNLEWRNNWGKVIKTEGSLINAGIQPSGFYIHKELWKAPKYRAVEFDFMGNRQISNSYSFLARIHDGSIIPNEQSLNTSLESFVRSSNNVAVNRNIVIAGKFEGVVFVKPGSRLFDLQINISANTANQKLPKYADLYLQLDDELLDIWKKNGALGEGFKLTDKGFLITSENGAIIKNLISSSDSINGFGTFVEFFSKETPESSDFEFIVSQIVDDTTVVDYMPFTAVRDMSRYFAVQAHAEAILTEKSLRLKADKISEPAKYFWYNQSGKEIGTESETEIDLPKTSQWYKLEVIAAADHYKDYDSVFVNIPAGFIASLTPNPTTDGVTVNYFLSDIAKTASLYVFNSLGNLVSSEPLDIGSKEKTLYLGGLLSGNYSVVLIINDVPSDSKTLIKQ